MIDPHSPPLSQDERRRLGALLETVSSHTLLKVLREMEAENADARLIIEVLLDRSSRDEAAPARHGPVMP